MRTTLMIDDNLLRRAKALAGRRGLTLSALVERALREQLRLEEGARESVTRYRVPTFGGSDGHAHEPSDLAEALLADDESVRPRSRRR